MDLYQEEWPVKIVGSRLAATSHTLTVPSEQPVTRLWPSGAYARALTALVCPRRSPANSCVAVSQTRIVPSPPPVARALSSGEKLTATTAACAPRSLVGSR